LAATAWLSLSAIAVSLLVPGQNLHAIASLIQENKIQQQMQENRKHVFLNAVFIKMFFTHELIFRLR